MPGGIMQLIFQGGQDVYLTGNPNMTYFKTVYRRYTQFGTEYITLQYDQLAIDYINKHPACRYIFMSSGAVYGSNFDEPGNRHHVRLKPHHRCI